MITRTMKYHLLLSYMLCLFVLSIATNAYSNKPNSLNQPLTSEAEITNAFLNNVNSAWFAGVEYSEEWASIAHADTSLADDTKKAREIYNWVTKEERYIQLFNPLNKYNLPVGLVQKVGGEEYIVIIDSISYTPHGAEMKVYMVMDVPFSKDKIYFKGSKIKFDPSGINGAKMELLRDYKVEISSETDLFIRKDGTFLEFDCNGYKQTTISADIAIDTSLLLPVNDTGKVLRKNKPKVSAKFETVFYDWNDLIIEISFSPFAINGLDGFYFKVSQAVIDLSDYKNAPGMVFPQGYTSPSMPGHGSPLWRGFYLKEFIVNLPKDLGKNVSISAHNMIIDNMGVSGTFSANNLITFDKGNISGWRFSMEKITAKLVANQVEKIEFSGLINIPIEKDKNKGFRYKANIDKGGDYLFSVALMDKMNVDIWLAEINLHKSSNVIIEKVNGKIRPKAILNGDMHIGASGKGIVDVEIQFQELTIQTIAPKFKVKAVSFENNKQGKFNNLPISINNLALVDKKSENATGLAFDANVNLMEGKSGFTATGGFTIWGQENQEGNKTSWKYKNTEIKSFSIDINTVAFKFKGSLHTYSEDAVYGNGFKGMIDAWFQPGIKVSATAQFGKVNGYRYWYADAMASVKSGIPVFTGFGIYGFGGGAYYHMKQESILPTQFSSAQDIACDTTTSPGVTMSRIKYIPDQRIALGLKATVIVGTHPKPEAFNGDATFEIVFNENGGLNKVGFTGNAYFFSALDHENFSSGSNKDFVAHMKIEYDVVNSSLYANFKIHMNLRGVIKGTGPDNLAGSIEMLFSPQDWYIRVGTPNERIGIEILKLLKTEAYFMVGTNIPGMPPPPPNVGKILGVNDLNFMRDENALKSGGGFAFGARAGFDTGDITFLIFYARFAAGVGFDIMLKNYGPDAHCDGKSSILGINGWYASGQIYAFVEGAIGIKVSLFGFKKKFEIIDLKAAAVFQAKLPNPTWIRGIVGGRYRILGGLISGNCKFEFTIGEECNFAGEGVVGGLTVISELSPLNGSEDVSVFTSPQAAFNMQVEKEFNMLDYDGTRKKYIIRLDHFKVTEGGSQLKGTYKWNERGLVYVFKPHQILPPEKEIKLEAQVHFEVFEGSWKPVKKNGRIATEILSANFKTGKAPNHIPQENVLYSYPFKDQQHFYPDEYNKGYIQLKYGQDYLFINEDFRGWPQKSRIDDGRKLDGNFTYNMDKCRIDFSIPTGIHTGRNAKLKLIYVAPHQANRKIDRNVKDKVEKRSEAEVITTQDIEGSLEQLEDKKIYECDFRISRYRTLAQKVNSYSKRTEYKLGQLNVWDLYLYLSGTEYFSTIEINGYTIEDTRIEPLIQLEAIPNNNWLNKLIIPEIYSGLQTNGITIKWRDQDILGVPPYKAVKFLGSRRDVKYYLPIIVSRDQMELRTTASKLIANGRNNSFLRGLVVSAFPQITIRTSYKFKANYILPGTNINTSSPILDLYIR